MHLYSALYSSPLSRKLSDSDMAHGNDTNASKQEHQWV